MNADICIIFAQYSRKFAEIRASLRIMYNNRRAILYKRRYIYGYNNRNDIIEYEIFDYYKLTTILHHSVDRLFADMNYYNSRLSYRFIEDLLYIDYNITKNIYIEISYKDDHIVLILYYNENVIKTYITDISDDDISIYDMIYSRIIEKLI